MPHVYRVFFLLVLTVLPAGGPAAGQADHSDGSSGPYIDYLRTAEFVVLELRGKGGYRAMRMEDFLAGRSDDQPSIQMLGNGRVTIRNDRKPYTIDLPDSEFHGLVEELVSLGVHALDTERLKADIRELDAVRFQESGRIALSTDVPTYTLKFRLSGFAPERGGVLSPIDAELSWRSVVMVARFYPDNEEVQRLARLEHWLGELTRRVQSASETGDIVMARSANLLYLALLFASAPNQAGTWIVDNELASPFLDENSILHP